MTTPPRDPSSDSNDDSIDDARDEDLSGDDFAETPSAELAHQRIIAALGALNAEARPQDDWQSRVLTSIRNREPTSPVIAAASEAATSASTASAAASTEALPSSAASGAPGLAPVIPLFRRRSFQVVTGGALAAAAALVLWVKRPDPGLSPQLLVEVSDSGRRPERSSSDPSGAGETRGAVGSTLRISAQSQAPHRALWIYRGDKHLVLACPGQGCTVSDDAITAELVVPLAGEYQVVALWSQQPIPTPVGQRDADLGAAERAGATKRSHSFTTW